MRTFYKKTWVLTALCVSSLCILTGCEPSERRVISSSYYKELQQENASLRAVLNGKLVSVPDSLYDIFILRELEKQEDEFNEAQLVGQVLGKYQLGIGDGWIALRLEQFIRDGLLIPVTAPEPDAPVYHRILKKIKK